MKYVDEFRDRGHAETLAGAIKRTVTRPWTIMEVCGGQTHSIVRFGLDILLLQILRLVQRRARTRSRGTYQSVRTCLYRRMRLSLVSTVAFSSLAVATMI